MISKVLRASFSKVYKSAQDALFDLKDGHRLLMGGFGIAGIPEHMIQAIKDKGTKDLTIVSNTGGIADWGIGILLQSKQVKRIVASYVGENKVFQSQYLNGQLELELVPQGTLGEKLRAAKVGVPAFYTRTGFGTVVSEGGIPNKLAPGGKSVEQSSKPKQTRRFGDSDYVLEQAIKGDFSLIKAKKGDTMGNLVFNATANNFNEDIAGSSKVCIAEVEELVEPGEIDPNHVHVPGILIDRIFKGNNFQRRFEKYVYFDEGKQVEKESTRVRIAKRIAQEVRDGMYINLGIGIPTLIPNYLPKGITYTIHSENGVMGVGPYPRKGSQHPDLINAGKETITVLPGASFFSSSASFGIVRGGHLDLTILGALEVAANGDIANWIVPGVKIKGMGGAMDLLASRSKVIVGMEHSNKSGEFKLLEKCKLPLTARDAVSMVVTEKAVLQRVDGRLKLTEVAKGETFDSVQKLTGFKLEVHGELKEF